MEIHVRSNSHGPIFSHAADTVIPQFLDDAEDRIGDMAVLVIRTELDHVLRNPTGFYRSNIQAERTGADVTVHDNDVIYGAWLEGVGSRNRSTRFKGYATFRRMTTVIRARAGQIANDLFDAKYKGRLG
jgi:hypothetical protein